MVAASVCPLRFVYLPNSRKIARISFSLHSIPLAAAVRNLPECPSTANPKNFTGISLPTDRASVSLELRMTQSKFSPCIPIPLKLFACTVGHNSIPWIGPQVATVFLLKTAFMAVRGFFSCRLQTSQYFFGKAPRKLRGFSPPLLTAPLSPPTLLASQAKTHLPQTL